MPTSGKGGGDQPRLTAKKRRATQDAIVRALQRQQQPPRATRRGVPAISDVSMETRRPKIAPYGQSLPDTVHPHIATPAEVARSRARKDPLVEAVKATKRDFVALAPLLQFRTGPGGYTGAPATKETAAVPQQILSGMAKSLYTDVRHPRTHKLNLLLDALTFGSGGASALGRTVEGARAASKGESVLRALKAKPVPGRVLPKGLLPDSSGFRKVRADGGEVQVANQSPNLLTAAAQHAADRLSERVPGAPVIGAQARIVRRVPEIQAQRTRRLTAGVLPLEHAARKLSGFRGASPSELAYHVIGNIGYTGQEGVRLVDLEIAQRQKLLATLTGKAAKQQATRISLLKAARPLVAQPSPELRKALELGRAASKETTASRVGRGALTEASAETAQSRHIRQVHGARFEKVPARKGRVRQTRIYPGRSKTVTKLRTPEEAKARLAALDAKYEAAVTKIAERVNPYADRRAMQAEQLRRNRLNGGRLAGGKRHAKQQTVTREVRSLAEDRLLALADKHPEQQFARDIFERQRLQEALNEHALGGDAQLGAITKTIPGKSRRVRLREIRAQKAGGGLVGAEDVKAGPQAFHVPDVEQRARLQTLFGRRKSVATPREKIHQSKGILFEQAREQVGPRVTVQDYLKEVRHRGQQADADLAHSFSRPFDPDAFNPEREMLLNPKGKTVPRYLKAQVTEAELEQLTPTQIASRLLTERTEWARHVFPEIHDVAVEHELGLRVLDRKIGEAIIGLDGYQAKTGNVLLKALDTTNDVNRAALVYLNPAYGPVQRTGNLSFLALQQGAWLPANLINNARTIRRLPVELQHRIDLEVGGGAAQSFSHEGQGLLKRPTQRLADLQNKLADRGPRRQAWVYEAGEAGYKTPEDIARLLTDPGLEPALNQVSERAQQAMVKFERTPTRFRRVVSRAVFITPWIEGSSRYAVRLALDRPMTARIAQEIRQRLKDEQKRVLGEGKGAVRGFIPIGGPVDKLGTTAVAGFNPMSMSPLGTAADVANTATGFFSGHPERGLHAIDFLQPTWTAGIEAATGLNTYTGHKYPESMSGPDILKENLVGTSDRPVSGLANVIATALRSPPGDLTGPASHQPSYLPEAGVKDAALRALLGSARPREANLPAVEAKGHADARAAMNPVERAHDDGQKLREELRHGAVLAGVLKPDAPLPVVVQDAIEARTIRYAAYARSNARTQSERLIADVDLLVSQGKLPRADVRVAETFLAGKPTDRQIEHQRALLGRDYFGSEVLARTRHEITIAKERVSHG